MPGVGRAASSRDGSSRGPRRATSPASWRGRRWWWRRRWRWRLAVAVAVAVAEGCRWLRRLDGLRTEDHRDDGRLGRCGGRRHRRGGRGLGVEGVGTVLGSGDSGDQARSRVTGSTRRGRRGFARWRGGRLRLAARRRRRIGDDRPVPGVGPSAMVGWSSTARRSRHPARRPRGRDSRRRARARAEGAGQPSQTIRTPTGARAWHGSRVVRWYHRAGSTRV